MLICHILFKAIQGLARVPAYNSRKMSIEEEGSSSQTGHNQELDVSESVEILLQSADSGDKIIDNFSPIYKVPSRLREINPSSFTPRVVSIGPIHRGRPNLKLMQDKKAIYLHKLLDMVGRDQKGTLTKCLRKVSNSIKRIKGCYFGECFDGKRYPPEDNGVRDDDNEFARMMVMDACFILYFINNLLISDNRLRNRSVAVDLVLLENQIPFFVLKHIYGLTLGTSVESARGSLVDMLHDLLERVSPFFLKLKVENLPSKIAPYHILGLLHKFYQPESPEPPQIKIIPAAHSAAELHKVGVRFRQSKEKQTKTNISSKNPFKRIESGKGKMMEDDTIESGKGKMVEDDTIESGRSETVKEQKDRMWLMAVEFEQSRHKPIFRMAEVLIDNFFEVVMRNLIAYEQYSTPVKNYVTSYAMAMSMLAATPDDIAKLTESDIIRNNLGSNEKASDMISSICKDVTFPDFYYIDSWEKAKKHYDSYWSKNFGMFKHIYFDTLWKAIALFAGIILFLFGTVQLVLRIITFVRSNGEH
ncbi:hypothetical protein SSX86_014963 [Deinandra increscens subsp. villosa]|uniref:Uncharacterized protein n=1 Tax=Deinandra increscens subsp. villosa TaxID=3103831 RepID=A0AAP0GYV0_9ASTR